MRVATLPHTHLWAGLVAVLVACCLAGPVCDAVAFSEPAAISSSAAVGTPAVGSDDVGNSTIAWIASADNRVLARRMSADGNLDPVLDVSGPDTARPLPANVAGVIDGSAVVVWLRASDDHVLARRVGGDGVLGATVDVSQQSASNTASAGVGVGADGTAVVVWRRGNDSHLMLRRLDAGGGMNATDDISGDPDAVLWGTSPSVTVDPAGNATAVWHRNTDCHILGRRVAPDGSKGPIIDMSGEPDSAIGGTSPVNAADPDGNVTFAWHRDSDKRTVARTLSNAGVAGEIRDLSDGAIPTENGFGIGAGWDGAVATAWQRASDNHVVARSMTASGSLGGTTDVSQADVSASGPALAVDGQGGIAVAWKRAADGLVVVSRTVGSGKPSNPAPKPPAGPGHRPIRFGSRKLSVVRGAVGVRLSCLQEAATCKGTLSLHAGRSKRASSAAAMLVGRAGFEIAGGKSKTITVKLRRKARRLMRGGKRLRVTATAVVSGAGGSSESRETLSLNRR